MSINKNSSVANPNIGFIPGSKVKSNNNLLDPIITKKKSRDLKNMDSKALKIKR